MMDRVIVPQNSEAPGSDRITLHPTGLAPQNTALLSYHLWKGILSQLYTLAKSLISMAEVYSVDLVDYAMALKSPFR